MGHLPTTGPPPSEGRPGSWTKPSGKWYLHLFAPEQPDLNWWNPEVRSEFERIIAFWLDRGADGFRIDVASALFKRPDLADRPVVRNRLTGVDEPDPAFSIFDQPELHDVYRKWREISRRYKPERVLVGEMFEPRRQSAFVAPDQLDMAFAMIMAPMGRVPVAPPDRRRSSGAQRSGDRAELDPFQPRRGTRGHSLRRRKPRT